MIKSFKHKGLEKFFHNDDRSRINQKHAAKLDGGRSCSNCLTFFEATNKGDVKGRGVGSKTT